VVAELVDDGGLQSYAGDRRLQAAACGAGALQLPAHAVDGVWSAEPARMQPGALARLALCRDEHPQLCAGESCREQLGDERVGRRLDAEGHLVDAVERWLEVDARDELARRGAGHDAARVEPRRERVGHGTGGTEALAHARRGQCGEGGEVADAEAPQQGAKGGVADCLDRQRAEKGWRLARTDDHHIRRPACRVLRGEGPVGDADLRPWRPQL
jgi:hypothetical protein